MSGGESRPPAIRARFGVLGHTNAGQGLVFMPIDWDSDKHRKRLKAIRNYLNGTSRRKKLCMPVSDTSPTPTPSLIVHPWFTESK